MSRIIGNQMIPRDGTGLRVSTTSGEDDPSPMVNGDYVIAGVYENMPYYLHSGGVYVVYFVSGALWALGELATIGDPPSYFLHFTGPEGDWVHGIQWVAGEITAVR